MRLLVHFKVRSCFHSPLAYGQRNLNTDKRRTDKRQGELLVKVGVQPDESWSWIYHQRPSHGWRTGKPPHGFVFLERTRLIIPAELPFWCNINSWRLNPETFIKLVQRSIRVIIGELSDILSLSALNSKHGTFFCFQTAWNIDKLWNNKAFGFFFFLRLDCF